MYKGFKLNRRYVYKGMDNKLHHWYDGSWNETIEYFFASAYKKLKELAISKGYNPDVADLDVRGWVKLADPSCIKAGEEYKIVQNEKMKSEYALVEAMTLPGLMTMIIDAAKKSRSERLSFSNSPGSLENKMIAWIGRFIKPNSDFYHKEFAKDLYEINPNWCIYFLDKEEQKELLQIYVTKYGTIPRGQRGTSTWYVPTGHHLGNFLGILKPNPSAAYKNLGTNDEKVKIALIAQIKQGKKPEEWETFKIRNEQWCLEQEEKYPKVLNYSDWRKNNLTPIQQGKIDKWIELEKLVSTDESDIELIKRLSTKERQFVGNRFKMLDQKFAFQQPKYIDTLAPIIKRLKEKRPMLYEIYCKKKKKYTADNFYHILGPGAKNEQKQKEIITLAKSGAAYPSNDRSLYVSISRFTGKNTHYPEFAKKLKAMRPDWFDKKLRSKSIRERYWSKKKAINE